MRTAPIGDLTAPVKTWNPSQEPNVTFEYIDLSAVDNASKKIVGSTVVVGSKAPSRARQLVAAGDILVSTVRPNLNAVAVVPPRLDGATASTGFTVLRPTPEVDAHFLFHWVRSPIFIADMVRKATGASYPAVSDRIVKDSQMAAPPLPKQRRIAAILDHADVLRAKRRQILAHLDTLTQSIFQAMFGSGTFEPVPAGALMPTMRNGLSPATAGTHAADVLTLSALTRGEFDPSAFKPGAFAVDPPADKRVTAGDFLMCRGNGNKRLVGAGTYSPVDRPDLVFPDTVTAGRIDTSRVLMPFLDTAWRRLEVRRQIEKLARTTNGTYKVNQQALSSVLVPVPPIEVQKEFAGRVERVKAHRSVVLHALVVDNELFATLQSRAFQGNL